MATNEERRDRVVQWMREIGDPWMRPGAPGEAAAGSELAADDAAGPQISPVAHHGLLMALDHLGAVVDAMTSGVQIRHYAHFTSMRTVLLSSARVRWLLQPEISTDRRLRCAQIRHQNLMEQRKALVDLGAPAVEAELEQQRQRLLAAMDAEKDKLTQQAQALGATQLHDPIDTVSMLRTMVDPQSLEGTFVLQMWRTGSASAHGYFWTDQNRSNPGEFDETWFNGALFASVLFADEAMKLYVRRAGITL